MLTLSTCLVLFGRLFHHSGATKLNDPSANVLFLVTAVSVTGRCSGLLFRMSTVAVYLSDILDNAHLSTCRWVKVLYAGHED